MSTPSSASSVTPGWYSDPYVARALRYHDGNAWTQHLAPAPAPAPAPEQAHEPSALFGDDPSDPVHWLLPTGRTWQSIAAGYIAICAMFIWPLGPVALAFGLWALGASKLTGGHGRGRAVFAVIVGTLATVAMGVLLRP